MFESFTKYFFMILCSFYFYVRLLNIHPSKKHISINIFSALLLSTMICFIKLHTPYLFISAIILGLFATVIFTYHTPIDSSFVTSLISFGFSNFTYFLSTILTLPLAYILVSNNLSEKNFNMITIPIIGILQLIIAKVPFRFSRLKRGMPFLYTKNFNDIGVLISIVILLTSSLYGLHRKDDLTFVILILFPALCGLLLFIWWRKQLTRTYRDTLHDNEIKELETELEHLKKDNENLSRIVHKDNKLIPAMELAVRELLTDYLTTTTQSELSQKATLLLESLNTLSKERMGIMHTLETQPTFLTATGSTRLDTLIRYMHTKALTVEIHFDFIQNANIKHLIETIIDEDSLCTIIADLIDNAIIATKEQQIKHILFSIDIENQHYCLNFYDSGIPFEEDTILNIGKHRTTTHSDSGGSGIGFMNTFELLRTFSASFIIDERIHSMNFTKKLCLRFDSLNEFRIISNRTGGDSLRLQRPDIIFESYDIFTKGGL